MPQCPDSATPDSLPDYRYQPAQAPSAELRATYGDETVIYEVIDHLRQLTESLTQGSIGLEYWRALSTYELSRVGW